MIQAVTHPEYDNYADLWEKWRLTYHAGDDFIENYLQVFSKREDVQEFADRKSMSYCPAFAKAGINEVKNAIFNRMVDVRRIGGPNSYQRAIQGNVDLRNRSMGAFMGGVVLPELLTMKKVGIYVDMPKDVGITLADKGNKRPYLYCYQAEDIRSWALAPPDAPYHFDAVLLRDHVQTYTDNLPDGVAEQYRYLYMEDGYVKVKFYDKHGELFDEQETDLPVIPFTVLELPDSLLADVANYQIALLNMESSDLNFIIRGNFPFYVEQYNPGLEPAHLKYAENFDTPGEATSQESRDKEIKVGISQGRRYPMNAEAPQFIHPSPEPLLASLKKGEQIRQDIRLLINLAVENMTDSQGLRDGLAFIALTLEQGEKDVAAFWAMYENAAPAQIIYPEDYSLQTDSDRISKAEGLDSLKNKIVSKTYQREISKRIVDALLGGRVGQDVLMNIHKEIDAAPTLTSDPKVIHQDLEYNLVSDETASRARGYADGEVEQAKKDRAERVKLTLDAQTSPYGGQARGVNDLQTGQHTSREEKIGKPTRGEGSYE